MKHSRAEQSAHRGTLTVPSKPQWEKPKNTEKSPPPVSPHKALQDCKQLFTKRPRLWRANDDRRPRLLPICASALRRWTRREDAGRRGDRRGGTWEEQKEMRSAPSEGQKRKPVSKRERVSVLIKSGSGGRTRKMGRESDGIWREGLKNGT